MKLGFRETKRVLKVLARRRLTPAVAHRSKSGFGVPLGDWFRSPVLAPALDRLRDPDHPAAQHFDRAELARVLAEHVAGDADHGEALWMLTNVYAWQDVVAREGAAPAYA
jgi:asparagine synthase (glutamine-hydrolysing)